MVVGTGDAGLRRPADVATRPHQSLRPDADHWTLWVRPPLPAALGAEGVGRIVSVGPTVAPVRIGERIHIVPTLEHGTWQDQPVINEGAAVPVNPKADSLPLSMRGINPLTADLLLSPARR